MLWRSRLLGLAVNDCEPRESARSSNHPLVLSGVVWLRVSVRRGTGLGVCTGGGRGGLLLLLPPMGPASFGVWMFSCFCFTA